MGAVPKALEKKSVLAFDDRILLEETKTVMSSRSRVASLIGQSSKKFLEKKLYTQF